MFGKEFMSILKAEKIDTENVTVTSEAATSVASVLVDKEGKNYLQFSIFDKTELTE